MSRLYLTGAVGILGFNRGLKKYDYEHPIIKNYLYTSKLCYGILGLCIYLNPAMLPFVIFKEMYRLEINVRGLEKTNEYYDLL